MRDDDSSEYLTSDLSFQSYCPAYTRAAAIAILFGCANVAGIISSNVYPSRTKPRFFEGHGIAIGFASLTIIAAIIMTIANRIENARRDRLYGPAAPGGSDVDFNKVLTPEQLRKWGLEGLSKTEIIELGDKHPGIVLAFSFPFLIEPCCFAEFCFLVRSSSVPIRRLIFLEFL